MQTSHDRPKHHAANNKRTKIIATVGPSTDAYESILGLIEAGATGLRLNFSHGTKEEREKQIKWIRKAAKACDKHVAIIQDLQGPKIRLGDFDGVVSLKAGQEISLVYRAELSESVLPVQYDLSTKVKRGDRIFMYDGKVKSIVTSVRNGSVNVKIQNEGIVMKRKGLNLPDTDFGGEILTKKDRQDIVFGSENDVDYVALSFVQSPDDLMLLRKMLKNLGSSAKVITKIETKLAVENIEDIVKASDAVMVARGDLAIETEHEVVPIMQRKIIGLGQLHSKPVIVATHMMNSMVDNPEPTRAEVSDVATAVLVGTDSVMLSDETASGKYPIAAVKMMKKIIRYTERNLPLTVKFHDGYPESTQQEAICNVIISLAKQLQAVAIVAETKSGATAVNLSARRPARPLIAVTSSERVANQLAICYSIKSYVRKDDKFAASRLTDWLLKHDVLQAGDTVITASGRYPGVAGATDTIKVRVLE